MDEVLIGVSTDTFKTLESQPSPGLRVVPIDVAGDCAPTVIWRRQPDRTQWVVDVLRSNPRIRWLHTDTAGVDRLPLDELRSRHVLLSNARGVYTPVVSQWAVAALLAVSMRLDVTIRNSDKQLWDVPSGIREVTGDTVVVVGLGSIGSAVARTCRTLGMRVAGMVRDASTLMSDDPRYHMVDTIIRTVRERNDALASARFVVLCVPLTDETRGMVDADMLSHVPPDAWLINVARGQIIDEGALVHALDGGRLAGAVLDTFAQEPLPQDSPLWGRHNVIVSAHASSRSDRTASRSAELFFSEAERYRMGLLPVNMIDYARGY